MPESKFDINKHYSAVQLIIFHSLHKPVKVQFWGKATPD